MTSDYYSMNSKYLCPERAGRRGGTRRGSGLGARAGSRALRAPSVMAPRGPVCETLEDRMTLGQLGARTVAGRAESGSVWSERSGRQLA